MSSKARRSRNRRWKWKWWWNNVTAEHTHLLNSVCAPHHVFAPISDYFQFPSCHTFSILGNFLQVCSVTCFRAIGPEIKSQIEKVSCGSIGLYFSSLNIHGRASTAEVGRSRLTISLTWQCAHPTMLKDVESVWPGLNPLTAEWALRALINFTLSNAKRFYSSMGNPLDGKGLSYGMCSFLAF